MYSNAARDDLWSKLSQVTFDCGRWQWGGPVVTVTWAEARLIYLVRFRFILVINVPLTSSYQPIRAPVTVMFDIIKCLLPFYQVFGGGWIIDYLSWLLVSRPCVRRGGTSTSGRWWTGGPCKWATPWSPSARTNQSSSPLITSPWARSTSCTGRSSGGTTGDTFSQSQSEQRSLGVFFHLDLNLNWASCIERESKHPAGPQHEN